MCFFSLFFPLILFLHCYFDYVTYHICHILKIMIMFTTSYVGGGGWGNPSLLLLPAAIVWVPSLTRPPILLFWRKGLIFIFVASYGTEYTEKISSTKTCLSSMFLAKESRLDWHRMKHCLRDWSLLILLLILIHLWGALKMLCCELFLLPFYLH